MQEDFVIVPKSQSVIVSTAPVQNFICSLGMLCRIETFSGITSGLLDVANSMSTEDRLNNRIAAFGLYYCYSTEREWPSVPAYLDYLKSLKPETFKNRLFELYADNILLKKTTGNPGTLQSEEIDQQAVLKSADSYWNFIKSNYPVIHSDYEVEAMSRDLLIDEEATKEFIINHLTYMWERYFEKEWKTHETMIKESTCAFQDKNFAEMERFEAASLITGQNLEDELQDWPWKLEWFRNVPRVVFVPSAHTGPYLIKMLAKNAFIICFNARLPEGSSLQIPDLNRNEINVRLNALADDTRLKILNLISEKEELSSQEIMKELSLSQSAASRHLKQLSATGYLIERRQTCAKKYKLNEEYVQKTLDAVSAFLKVRQQ